MCSFTFHIQFQIQVLIIYPNLSDCNEVDTNCQLSEKEESKEEKEEEKYKEKEKEEVREGRF